MLDKLEAIKGRFENIGVSLTNPEVVKDQKRFSQLSKEYRKLEKIVNAHKQYTTCLASLAFAAPSIPTVPVRRHTRNPRTETPHPITPNTGYRLCRHIIPFL